MSEYIKELRHQTDVAKSFFAEKLAFTLGPVELKELMEKDHVKVVDVRYKEDYDTSHIPSAISMPKPEIREKLNTLSKDDVHVVYCYNQQCHLGAATAFALAENGYPVMELDGGFQTWVEDFHFAVIS